MKTSSEMQSGLRRKARELLDSGAVEVVLGWRYEPAVEAVRPAVFRKGDNLDELVFDERCVHNLANFLAPILERHAKVAVVLKGCDGRALSTLEVEKRVDRSKLAVLAPACEGVTVNGARAQKCDDCPTGIAPGADHVFGTAQARTEAGFKTLERIEKMTPDERWQFFAEQFAKCQRCYACRQVCPMCYCETCIADASEPRWIEPSRKLSANTMWHLVRAWHLAGRCSDCGECQRACPEGIPIRLLNAAVEKLIRDEFGVRPGTKRGEKPPLVTLAKDDSDDVMGEAL